MTHQPYQPVLEVTRGSIVESVHYGAIAVVDSHGKLLASYGDPDVVTFLRSTAKPFQALPFMELGGADRYGFTDEEVALMCASHSGTDEHVRVVKSMQSKIGVTEDHLMCGVHYPLYDKLKYEMIARGETPTPYRHNCSGKHTGMLAQAQLRGVPLEDYLNFNHPVQTLDLQAFAEMCDMPVKDVELGIDGCSAPVFAVPLRKAAYGYARLCDPFELEEKRAAACRRLTRAMSSFPFMVAGPERFDTLFMEQGGGRMISKAGAEGYQGIGLLPGVLSPDSPGVGIMFKIADGDQGGRARPALATALVRMLGLLNDDQMQALAEFDHPVVRNWRKLAVGEIRTCFELTWH